MFRVCGLAFLVSDCLYVLTRCGTVARFWEGNVLHCHFTIHYIANLTSPIIHHTTLLIFLNHQPYNQAEISSHDTRHSPHLTSASQHRAATAVSITLAGIRIGVLGTKVATLTCGHVRPAKFRFTTCEYWIWVLW